MTVRKRALCIVALMLNIGSSFSNEPMEFSTSDLPNAAAPKVSPADQNVRIQTLLSQISSLNDFSSVFVEDLSTEVVQKTIIETKPTLMMKLPKGVQLNESAMDLMAKRFYRFDFFLPPYLRGQDSVKNAFKQNKELYGKNYNNYLAIATKFLHEGKGDTLVHPDFFYDSTFVFVYVQVCSQSANQGPGGMMNPANQSATHNSDLNRKAVFGYLRTKGIFTQQHKTLFLSKHPTQQLPIECYPTDFLLDKNFVTEIDKKALSMNFVGKVMEITRDDNLQDVYVDQIIQKLETAQNSPGSYPAPFLTQNAMPGITSAISVEDFKFPKVQAWVLDRPYLIYKVDPRVKFEKNLLIDFAKKHAKPARFFTDAQKSDPQILSLMEEHGGTSDEVFKADQHLALKEFAEAKCCGTTYSKDLERIVSTLPDEFLSDDEFIIESLRKVRAESELLLEYVSRKEPSKKIKEYILSKYQTVNACSWFSRRTPEFLNRDTTFRTKLEVPCQKLEAERKARDEKWEKESRERREKWELERKRSMENRSKT